MRGGYVIFWRAAMDSPIFDDDWLWRLFCWCVLKANFEDDRFHTQVVKRGQFVTGRIIAAELLNVSPSKWYRGMLKLVEYGAVAMESNNKWTTITVCNYELYQDKDAGKKQYRTTNEQPTNNQRTTSGHNKNTSNTSNTSNKEYPQDFIDFWNTFPPIRRTKKAKAFCAWVKAVERASPETILDAVRAFSAAPIAKSQFCPGPEPWLNGDCWEDSRESWQDSGRNEKQPESTTARPASLTELANYQP